MKRSKRELADEALCDDFPWLHKLYWFVGAEWRRLHFIDGNVWDRVISGMGKKKRALYKAACGRRIQADTPGIFSRMGTPRCKNCCRALGIPQGKGSGINDHKLVALARRLARKEAQALT